MYALVGLHLLTQGGDACVGDERRVERVLGLPRRRRSVRSAMKTVIEWQRE